MKEASFLEHLEELRRRILCSIVAVVIGSGLSFRYSHRLLEILYFPLKGKVENLILLKPQEGLLVYLKVSIFSGIVLASPFILYHFWAFLSPGLFHRERKAIFPLVAFSPVLFLTGVLFAYKVVIPVGLDFLLRFTGPHLLPTFSLNYYISFVTRFLIGLGVLFQVPLIVAVLTRMDILRYRDLLKFHRYAILGAFVVSALLTPPDIVTQLLLGLPLILLFEFSVLISWIISRSVKIEKKGGEDGKDK
ncbi:twin-arginine translocase subunit TatC [Candidatus Calescamantes bacterium]|nr:twin-arginine translocase subunit TatC [Candidatus Calescamantes bacterium]